MGGTVLETKSEKLIRQGKMHMLVELGLEAGFEDTEILKRMQEKIGLSLEEATDYLEYYRKQLV